MKTLQYVGPGTGPSLSVGVLDSAYDFSANAIQEVSDADAKTLLTRCGRSYIDITQDTLSVFAATKVGYTTLPVKQTAVLVGKTLTLTYNGTYPLDQRPGFIPVIGSFAPILASVSNPVVGMKITGKTVILTLTTAATSGQVCTLGYTQAGGTAQLRDTCGNKAANLVASAVTNSTPA